MRIGGRYIHSYPAALLASSRLHLRLEKWRGGFTQWGFIWCFFLRLDSQLVESDTCWDVFHVHFRSNETDGKVFQSRITVHKRDMFVFTAYSHRIFTRLNSEKSYTLSLHTRLPPGKIVLREENRSYFRLPSPSRERASGRELNWSLFFSRARV